MRTAIVWVGLVVATGCGDGRPDISTTSDNVCSNVADVACFDMYQCCAEGEIERALGVSDPRTEAECVDDVTAICNRQLAAFDFSIKNKHVRFDSAIMNACLKAFLAPANTCVEIAAAKPWTEACMTSAWVGVVDNGAACDFVYECAKDSFCNASRVCTALPTDGMPCGVQGCASGLFCDVATCHPLLVAGATCTSTPQCAKGLFCDLAAATHTCTALHATGEPCTGNTTCTSNTCLPGSCAGSNSTCFSAGNCSAHCADDGSFCITDGNCATGTCSITATACAAPTDCTGVGNTCMFPVKCQPAECVGPVVCGDARIVVDYCTGPLNELPLF